MTHATRHPSRLDRDFGRKQWGDEGYAKEELVAELGAAFLCADLGITPEIRDDHAAYIGSWLKALQDDKRFIFSAAAHAQRAVDFLHSLQPGAAEPDNQLAVA
jgi:antirestriction protein ArdC